MSVTVAGALLTAGVLGVTHAIEPDHVAGIASLTGRYGDSRLSALVGADSRESPYRPVSEAIPATWSGSIA